MTPFPRRSFLKGAAALGGSLALPAFGFAQSAPKTNLTIGTRTLEAKGRAATVFGITNEPACLAL